MKIKVTGYKLLGIGLASVFYLIALGIGISLFVDESEQETGIYLLSISSVLYFLFLFIPDSFFMKIVFNNYKEDNPPDYFMIYAAKLVNLDSHFSSKERKRVKKYLNNEYGLEFSGIKMNNFELLVTKIDEYFPKYKHMYKSVRRIDRLRLMNLLVGIAVTDRFLSNQEKEFLETTAENIGLTKKDLTVIYNTHAYVTEEETEYQRKLKSKPINNLTKAFSILGLNPDSTLKEAKESYRELVKIYHPDKLHATQNKETAKQQFQAITDAYDTIKASKTN